MTDDLLSEREREILTLVATGAANKEIAARLGIASNTVKVHLRNIFEKIGAASRTEATLWAVRMGLADHALPAAGEPAAEAVPAGAGRRSPRLRALLILGGFAVLAAAAVGVYAWMNRTLPATAPATNWKLRAAPGIPRLRPALAATGGMLYAAGGETGDGLSAALEVYDPAMDAWSRKADLPAAAGDAQMATLGGRIYLPGGRRADGTYSDELWSYNPTEDAWSRKADLPAATGGYALAVFEGRLWMFGGRDGAGWKRGVWAYDPETDAWSAGSELPAAWSGLTAAAAGERIFLLPHAPAAQNVAMWEFDPTRPEEAGARWRELPAAQERADVLGAFGFADMLIVLGADGSSLLTGIFRSGAAEWQPWSDIAPAEYCLGASIGFIGTEAHCVGGGIAHAAGKVLYTVMLPQVGQ